MSNYSTPNWSKLLTDMSIHVSAMFYRLTELAHAFEALIVPQQHLHVRRCLATPLPQDMRYATRGGFYGMFYRTFDRMFRHTFCRELHSNVLASVVSKVLRVFCRGNSISVRRCFVIALPQDVRYAARQRHSVTFDGTLGRTFDRKLDRTLIERRHIRQNLAALAFVDGLVVQRLRAQVIATELGTDGLAREFLPGCV